MRRAGFIGVLFFVVTGLFVNAAAYTRPPAKICAEGTTIRESGAMGITTTKAQGKAEYTNLIRNSNFCTNEVVTVAGVNFFQSKLENEATCICRNAEELAKVGCGPGQTQPRITTTVPKQYTGCATDTIVVSKCSADPDDAYSKACQGQDMSRAAPMPNIPNEAQKAAALPPVGGTSAVELSKVLNGQFDGTNSADRQKATQALVTAGMSTSDANEAIKRIASGDADGGKKLVQQDLNLNPVTLQKITSLTSGGGPQAVDVGAPETKNQQRQTSTGFGAPEQNAGQGVSRDLNAGARSPFASITGGGGGFGGFGSPFAHVTPAGSRYFASAPRQAAPVSSYPSVMPIQNSVQPQPVQILQPSTPVEQSSIAQQLLQALRGTEQAVPISPSSTSSGTQAVAAILAQPRSVTRGNPVALSWSSVGMKESSPCVVRAGPAIIAQKNQGSKILAVGLGAARGALTFTLSCTAASGQSIEKATSVNVN